MTSLEKFDKWFTEPLKKIESSDADAAYIVAGASFALFERFIDSRMRMEKDTLGIRRMDGPQKKEFFFTLSISVLKMTDLQLFKDFWDMYRNGIAHSFQPMTIKRDGVEYVSGISAGFPATPRYQQLSPTITRIEFSPWAWSRTVVEIWRGREDLLDALPSFPLGEIFWEARRE